MGLPKVAEICELQSLFVALASHQSINNKKSSMESLHDCQNPSVSVLNIFRSGAHAELYLLANKLLPFSSAPGLVYTDPHRACISLVLNNHITWISAAPVTSEIVKTTYQKEVKNVLTVSKCDSKHLHN